MANNKVVFGQEVLIDLTQDTVTPYALEEGYTAHAPSGEKIVGVMKPNKPVEVETNAEMTTISTGATEKDLGKVYLFVGEDDGVFEKDALYILVKKGSGYGFQRYAIGGSGEAGEDLTAVLDEQSQLIAELKEKLANGGSGGGSQECDCIIDVAELPTENIDKNAVYRSRSGESTEIWMASNLNKTFSLADFFLGMLGSMPDLTYYLVDALPEPMVASDMEEFSAFHVYILRSTGVGYISADGTSASAMSVATAFTGSGDGDMGWADDVSSIVSPDPDGSVVMAFYAIPVPPSTTYGVPTVENTFVYGHNGSSWDEFAVKETLLASANFTDYAELTYSADGITIEGVSSAVTCLKIQGNVTSIANSAFGEQPLKSVIIPTSVTSIGSSAFSWCLSLTSIVYNGTKEQWKAITKGDNWDESTPDYIITCTDGTIAKDGTET